MKKLFLALSSTPIRRIAIVIALHEAWFWVPIWVLYYRRFTGYGGVALLESLSMGIYLLMIIPGGMLADYLGRKRLIIIASIMTAVSATAAGVAPSFEFLIPAILFLSLSGGLYMASIEAFLYDTLKSEGREHAYERVYGKVATVRMISCALASAVGGWMYSINPSFPWFAVGVFTTISALVAFTLKEPRIETVHDSFKSFFREAGKGLMLLFRERWRVGVPLVLAGVFLTMDSSGLWDLQAVSFGYTSKDMGILLTALYIVLALGSVVLPKFLRRFGDRSMIGGSVILFALLWGISGFLGGLIGGVFLILRGMIALMVDIKSSVMWNRMIPSPIRATTLSTITIIRGIPYMLIAYQLGSFLDAEGIRPIIFSLSGILFCIMITIVVLWKWGMRKSS